MEKPVCRECRCALKTENWPACNRRVNRRICSPCNTAKVAQWKSDNRERRLVREREWRRKNVAKLRPQKRAERMRRVYGMTVPEFNAMLDAQGGKCANQGCNTSDPGHPGWSIDHDHATGEVRGILCRDCNWLIGLAGDSSRRLKGAADYLERQRVAQAG